MLECWNNGEKVYLFVEMYIVLLYNTYMTIILKKTKKKDATCNNPGTKSTVTGVIKRIITFKKFFCYCCLMILILPIPILGQHYNFKVYSIEDGLAQSQVHAIYQDTRGYLWLGTLGGGVSRFDGITFSNFTKKDGLADNHVLTIFEDTNSHLWFGTYTGVTRYDGRTFFRLNAGNGLSHTAVRAILEDPSGNLWFGTEKGLWKYDRKTFYYFNEKDGLGNKINTTVIRTMVIDREGILWIGTEGDGISRYDGETFTHFSTVHGLAGNTVHSILEDRNGDLWFGTHAGVSKYDRKTFRNYTVTDGLSSKSIRSLIEDREGNIWFGTNGGGVCKFDGRIFTCMTEKNGLSSNVVWALHEGREGNIWIGTYRGGLNKYSDTAFTYFSSEDGLGDDVIRSILVDRTGNFWFGTYRGGVTRFDGKSMTTFTTKDGLIDNFVLTIFEDREGNLWFGTFGGVSKYDGEKFFNINQEDGLPDRIVRAIIEDRAGHIWFGTNKGGLSRYDGKTITNFFDTHGLNDNQITSFTEDREGHIWIGTLNGVCHYDGNTFTNFSKKCGFKQKNIYSIIEDEKGNLWFGIFGDGIIKYTAPPLSDTFRKEYKNGDVKQTGSFEVFNSKDGLHNDNVVSMAFDDRGKLWVGTEKGICWFDAEGYEKTGHKIFKHYGRDDGVVGMECIHNSICKDSNGNMWFGTIKGAVTYNPHKEHPNLTEPLTHITDIRLLFEENTLSDYTGGISPGDGLPIGLRLPYNKNHLLFDFIGLSFTAPEKVKYQCKLEGFDDLWIPVKEGSYATYSNLPPGEYNFRVKASNNEGIWNKEPTSFRFKIIPPFWQTVWFYLCCAGAVVVGIYFFITVRIRHLKKQRSLLKEKVRLSTEALKKEKEKVETINLELEHRVQERTIELRQSEEKFRLLVENANDAIFIIQDGVIKFPNPSTVEMLGYSSEELEKIPFNRFIYPEDRDKVPGRHTKSLERGKLLSDYSFRVINKSNKELWVDLTSVPILWEDKPATLNFFRDITEKKRLEARFFQSQKMEAIGTMAGGIAHDFNNILMGILGNVSLILSEMETGHPYYEELENIEKYVQNGTDLTRQLLGFTKRGTFEMTLIDLNRTIKKSAQMFSRTRKEFTIHEKYEPELWAVEADRGQIEQALLNLYVNAWQAMRGGGDIYLQTENVTLDEREVSPDGLKPGTYVKFSITDTGVGMDEATQQRIFEPFFTTKEMSGGAGLGLATVYSIVANHGGTIHVYSKKGHGTTFTIYLPASEKEMIKEKKLPILPKDYFKGTETVLLVDDETMVLEVGEKYLRKLGYNVQAASSGNEAIKIYDKNKDGIDLVILDMVMPGMGGEETFDRLRQMNPDVKVLLSSGYSINGKAAEILKRGCNDFIQKPFKLIDLSQKIRSILDI
jgi:PAS domain S-box-containing protein